MRRNTSLHHALILIWVLAMVHILAELTDAYRLFWWADIMTHFLGGVWVALAALWFWYESGYMPTVERVRPLVIALAAGLVIGLLWECYELIVWNLSGLAIREDYLVDTGLDLLMDTSGAFVGYWYYTMIPRPKERLVRDAMQ